MKKIYQLTAITAFLLTFLLSPKVFAADGSWTNTSVFPAEPLWADAANWAGGTIADGLGSTAYFTNGISAGLTTIKVVKIGDSTIENMEFSIDGNDPTAWYALAGSNETLTLVGLPTINVATSLYAVAMGYPGYGGELLGTNGFTKTGPGRLYMYQPHSISGTVNLVDGEIFILDNNGLQNADINIDSGKRLYVGNGIVMNSGDITIENNGRLNQLGVGGTHGVNANIIAKGQYVVELSGSSTNNLNGTYELDAVDWAGMALAHSNTVINVNNNIIGSGKLDILAHGNAYGAVVNFNAPCTYTGANTQFGSQSSAPRYELNINQTLPTNDLRLYINTILPDVATITLDLNDNTQKVAIFNMDVGITPPKGQYAELTAGPAGRLEVTNRAYVSNGKCIINGGNHFVEPYFTMNDNAELVLTNTTVDVKNEFLLWGSNSIFTLNNGGVANNNLTRFAQPAYGISTLNLNSGSKIKLSGTWGGELGGIPYVCTQSVFNFNGGIMSDGNWGPHAYHGDYDWMRAGTSNIVQSGGAIFEVNNINGREISEKLLHDSALGGTLDGGLTKIGAETLTLSASNTYTGPTIVNAGSLLINGDIAASLANNDITVSDGAKIGGLGNLGDINLPAGASIAPGASIGSCYVNDLTMNSGSMCDWEVNDGNADSAIVSGSLDISAGANSVTVNVNTTGLVLDSETNIIFETAGTIVGDVSSIFLNYVSGEGPETALLVGNDIVVTGITPEPGILGLLSLFALGFLRKK